MIFKSTTIPPKGRNKYGTYIASANVTKKVATYTNSNTIYGNDNNQTPTIPNTSSYGLTLSKTQGNFQWDDISANNGYTDTVQVYGFKDLDRVPVFVGNLESDIVSTNCDIYGMPDGISVTVTDNGTTGTTVNITADTNVVDKSGKIYIPANIYTGNVSSPDDDDKGNWIGEKDSIKTLWLEYNFTIQYNAITNYHLELTNEIAGINCDKDGNILTDAVRPSCQAMLFLGNSAVENVAYGLGTFPTDKAVQGITINTATGELTFGSNFTFAGTMLEVRVTATHEDYTTYKIMTVNKVLAGKDGTSITRWIVPSADVITYDPNTNYISPRSVAAKVMKQVNNDPPIEDSETIIYYGWNVTKPANKYTGGITVNVSYDYLSLALKNEQGIIYELETIPIVKDGTNGTNGEKGTKGASIRGPIDYRNITKDRRFCNGVLTDTNYPEDEYYIDIVVFDGIYYQCKQSYNWDGRDVDYWDVGIQETYWTRVDEQYEFVAANLLLAENGKINFASSNELYLLDDRDNVTAGAAGGTGVNFWAGASAPTNAPFTVDNNGKMIAKKGTFGNLSITTDEFGDAELYGEHIQADETTKNTISIQPHLIKMDARDKDISEKQSSYSTITIAPYFDSDIYDYNAPLQVDTYGRGGNAIWTDGDVTASNIDVYGEYTRTYTNPEDDAQYTMNEWASMSPIPNLRIVPLCTTNALFTRYNNIWHFNNVSLGISSLLYPTIVQHPADYSWGFKSSSGTSSKWTGIASAQTPKQNNVLYIKLN